MSTSGCHCTLSDVVNCSSDPVFNDFVGACYIVTSVTVKSEHFVEESKCPCLVYLAFHSVNMLSCCCFKDVECDSDLRMSTVSTSVVRCESDHEGVEYHSCTSACLRLYVVEASHP